MTRKHAVRAGALAALALLSRSAGAQAPGPVIEMPPAEPALGARPAATAPSVKGPPENPSQLALPRESAIENPLGRAPAIEGSAIGGYGELTFDKKEGTPSVIDLRRFVLYFGHNFNEHLRFYSEVEVEHAISSSTDEGEVEIEQAYLDGLVNRRFNLRGGLIIMPVGIINVYHEPPTFNGVDRPEVDQAIIPSTWREAGFGVFGQLTESVRYQAYVVTAFNANGFTAELGIRDGHQEAQLARASDFGAVARLDFEPRLGTDIGVSAYHATSGNDLRDTVGSVPVSLIEADARTHIGGFTARAEVVAMFIGDAAALNTTLMAAGNMDGPVASRLQGGYVEAGYDLLRLIMPGVQQTVTAFGRYDYVDTQAQVPDGFMARPDLRRQTVITGLVYRPITEIALKLDVGRRYVGGGGPAVNQIASAITWMF